MKKADKDIFNKMNKMKKIPKQVKEQLKPKVKKLMEIVVAKPSISRVAIWKEIKDILDLLALIKNIENDYKFPFDSREDWERFYEWCADNGANFTSVEVFKVGEENYGLKAKSEIMENDPFLAVPRKLMMDEYTAKAKLGSIASDDAILQTMPNVKVAVHLLSEVLDPKSFWQPYISILPSNYSTILYFNFEELKAFQNSPAIDDIYNLLRSVVRQYCYFFEKFELIYSKSNKIGSYFTYDLYRWAVSTVMTRQNFLPSKDGLERITSLIPLYDMCNHTNGVLSTDFNVENDSLVSYSFKSFSKGEEVFMFYGPRTNAEFVVHNGFVFPENKHDTYKIKLAISKNDPLYASKSDLCKKVNIPMTGHFHLQKENPVVDDLLTFLQINVLKSDEIENILNDCDTSVKTFLDESSDLKKRAYSFLKDRAHLLLKSYETTLEEDEESLIHNAPESQHYEIALKLRICEKRILINTMQYCQERLD